MTELNPTFTLSIELLDASRGPNPWTGGERSTLRSLLTRRTPPTNVHEACAAGVPPAAVVEWDAWRTRPDNDLRWRRTGAWDANDLDTLAIVEWEIARRKLGVSVADACIALGLQERSAA